jgi:hypothetical protein
MRPRRRDSQGASAAVGRSSRYRQLVNPLEPVRVRNLSIDSMQRFDHLQSDNERILCEYHDSRRRVS